MGVLGLTTTTNEVVKVQHMCRICLNNTGARRETFGDQFIFGMAGFKGLFWKGWDLIFPLVWVVLGSGADGMVKTCDL